MDNHFERSPIGEQTACEESDTQLNWHHGCRKVAFHKGVLVEAGIKKCASVGTVRAAPGRAVGRAGAMITHWSLLRALRPDL